MSKELTRNEIEILLAEVFEEIPVCEIPLDEEWIKTYLPDSDKKENDNK